MQTTTREHPILFRPELVRKILDGKKTQTRRPLTARNSSVLGYPGGKLWKDLRFDYDDGVWNRVRVDGPNNTMFGCGDNCQYLHVPARQDCDGIDDMVAYRVRPTMLPGDVLWVRETWNKDGGHVSYLADGDWIADYHKAEPNSYRVKWRPSIHMPRWACRLRLEITDVRVERIQSISAKDIMAEGVVDRPHYTPELGKCPVSTTDGCCYPDLRSLWAAAWEKAYKGSWQRNDWVWVIAFKKID